MSRNFPLQPLEWVNGVIRFKKNRIVDFLLDEYKPGLNRLAEQGFSNEEFEQFAQLIGYSVDGFGTLSYVRNPTWRRVSKVLANFRKKKKLTRRDRPRR